MADRFYADSPFLPNAEITLSTTESHHLVNVLRKKIGDSVSIFNGQGGEATADIVHIARNSVQLTISKYWNNPPAAGAKITIATAVPKGERFRWLIEKATELGVSQLIPLTTQRSVVQPGDGKLEKMRHTVIAAVKQSGTPYLLKISPLTKWSQFLQQFASQQPLFIAHPNGDSFATAVQKVLATNNSLTIAIGPEGGFTEMELQEAKQVDAKIIGLGEQILRIETAAIAVAAYCRFHEPNKQLGSES